MPEFLEIIFKHVYMESVELYLQQLQHPLDVHTYYVNGSSRIWKNMYEAMHVACNIL